MYVFPIIKALGGGMVALPLKRRDWGYCCGMIILGLMLLSPCRSIAQNVYTIGAGDLLEISVWRDESLSRIVVVPPDNIISFPLIGDINVTKMTVADLRLAVTKKLSEFIPDATVTVIVKEIHSLTAFVIGKVIKPGVYSIQLNTDVMQVLSMAGGLNPYADNKKIRVMRRKGTKTVQMPFDYSEVIKGKNTSQNIILEPGDVIVVP
jgi:polysaccharide export outer membrane protein